MVMSGSTHTYIIGTFSLPDILVEEGIGSTSESDVVVGCYCVEGPTKRLLSSTFLTGLWEVLSVSFFLFLLVFFFFFTFLLSLEDDEVSSWQVACDAMVQESSQIPNLLQKQLAKALMFNMDVKHKFWKKNQKQIHQSKLLPGKLTCPLKINGWKMYFLLK